VSFRCRRCGKVGHLYKECPLVTVASSATQYHTVHLRRRNLLVPLIRSHQIVVLLTWLLWLPPSVIHLPWWDHMLLLWPLSLPVFLLLISLQFDYLYLLLHNNFMLYLHQFQAFPPFHSHPLWISCPPKSYSTTSPSIPQLFINPHSPSASVSSGHSHPYNLPSQWKHPWTRNLGDKMPSWTPSRMFWTYFGVVSYFWYPYE